MIGIVFNAILSSMNLLCKYMCIYVCTYIYISQSVSDRFNEGIAEIDV